MAFDKALKVTYFSDMEQEFPPEVFDRFGNQVFDFEGNIHWKICDTIQVNHIERSQISLPRTIFRFVEWTDTRDPIERWWSKDSPETYEEFISDVRFEYTEKEEFLFFKDYTVFPRVFNALRKDLDLFYERSIEFYHRRINEIKNGEGIVDLSLKDLKKDLKANTSKYKKRKKVLEEQEIISFNLCKESLDFCLKYHDRPIAHFERGVFCFLEGDTPNALEHVYKAINLSGDLDALQNQAVLLKGQMESELGLYTEAIESLTRVIQKDPTHKVAYFERASAYFEAGEFDLALTDYLVSELKSSPAEESFDCFSLGLFKGAVNGSSEATLEYIPNILSSVHGLGCALWAFAENPVRVSKDLAEAAYHCMEFFKENSFDEILKEISAEVVPEIEQLVQSWSDLTSQERGERTGFILGKYGIEIFAGGKLLKEVSSFRNLKKANSLMTFESATLNEQNRLAILAKSKTATTARKEAFNGASLRIEIDKQGKHIVGHRNYNKDLKKSIFDHPNPQGLVNKYAGTGLKEAGLIGEAGYQEIVNFEEFIGWNVVLESGEKIPTTWGKIHYSKQGVHIVPTTPRELPTNLVKQEKL